MLRNLLALAVIIPFTVVVKVIALWDACVDLTGGNYER